MTPAIVDLTSDFNPAKTMPVTNGPTTTTTTQRTLLLAPPSIASREDRISALFAAHPRATTDLHMLDRLAAGLVTLPAATYDLVLVLTDPDGSRRAEAAALLAGRGVWARLAPAIKAGGRMRSEDGSLGAGGGGGGTSPEGREAVLAGLVAVDDGDGFTKPEYAEEEVVPLRFGLGKKKDAAAVAVAVAVSGAGAGAGQNGVRSVAAPAGVGFVDFSDDLDLDAEDDDDVIDEDTLLTEEDLRRPIQQPPECQPQPGKKRRACKDCTCGLVSRLEAEDKARRAKADKDLNTLKLKSEDLNELDFTVAGKTGSCGSCYLGDAFRCADCPYIGLPAFKPGEQVKILSNTVQL